MALLTLDEAKAQLNIRTTASDVELQMYIDSLTSVIEGYVGVVEEREVTETVVGQGPAVALLQPPVLSLTSLTPVQTGGTAVDVARLHVDGPSGVVGYADRAVFSCGPWTAVYSAGRAEVPPTIKLAALLLLQHLWRTKNGPARGATGADDYAVTEPVPGFGYAVPNRVLELLEPFKLPPGIG
ncbi:phage gp6-like head-tail connector protein [Streptomyces sp. NBC_01201]|uniref:head-tail connector protein n=1 Tax=unclassified Streptomyces TaxID=2593676 RepID=UPI002E128CB2|nr:MULTISPECIES: head-tail connector protein [unclassified Streptomyces]WSR09404.1 phage gp6-like head-tail connector protein [Streptomyces sp. NBC_01208]WSR47868.1 phage gp6-like head-tail connector protein [Streptomyces sp. NBC_01201]